MQGNKNIDCRFIANKIIIENNKTKTKDSLGLTIGRLGKLVLLVEIAYMQRHGSALIKDNYTNSEKGYGLLIERLFCSYDYAKLITVQIPQISSISFKENIYSQQEVEQLIGDKLNSEIDDIVKSVMEITNNTDSVDLREMLRLDKYIDIPDTMRMETIVSDKVKYVPKSTYIVPKYFVYQAYKDFDFKKLEHFNQEQTF